MTEHRPHTIKVDHTNSGDLELFMILLRILRDFPKVFILQHFSNVEQTKTFEILERFQVPRGLINFRFSVDLFRIYGWCNGCLKLFFRAILKATGNGCILAHYTAYILNSFSSENVVHSIKRLFSS